MLKKFLTVATLLAAVTGCATTENYKKMLDSWVGAPELDLVRKWGAPANSYETAGSKFLTYQSARNVYVPGVAPTYQTRYVNGMAYTRAVGGSQGYSIDAQCSTTFEVIAGRVASWRAEGNDCKALPPE